MHRACALHASKLRISNLVHQEKMHVTSTLVQRMRGANGFRGLLPAIGLASIHNGLGNPECRDDDQVVGMHSAFSATGGLLSIAEVQTLFHRHGATDENQLADWIRARDAIAFEWQQETWLPMFQFSRKTMGVHASMKPVLRELSAIYDGWETANWFALRNNWLAGRAPVDMLTRDLSAVLYAARVDCFIACGEVSCATQPLRNAPADLPHLVSSVAHIEDFLTEQRHPASHTAACH